MEPPARPVGKVPVMRDAAGTLRTESPTARSVLAEPSASRVAPALAASKYRETPAAPFVAPAGVRQSSEQEKKPGSPSPSPSPASTSSIPLSSSAGATSSNNAMPMFAAPITVIPRPARAFSPQTVSSMSATRLPSLPTSAGSSPPMSPGSSSGKGELDWMEFLKSETAASSSAGSASSGSGRNMSPAPSPSIVRQGSSNSRLGGRDEQAPSSGSAIKKSSSPPSPPVPQQPAQMDWAAFLKSETSPPEKKDLGSSSVMIPRDPSRVGWVEALAAIKEPMGEPPKEVKEAKEAKESFLSRVSKARLIPSVDKAETVRFRDIVNMDNSADMRNALKKYCDQNPNAIAARVNIGGRDRVVATPYLLFEASEAHNLKLCVELLKIKAPCNSKGLGGNLPLHALMRSPPPPNVANDYALTAGLYEEILKLTVRNASSKSILETLNDRGESPLFLASVSANFVAVSQLIALQVNVYSAFLPDVHVASHGATYLSVHAAVMSAVASPDGLHNSGGKRGSKDDRRRSLITRAGKRRSGSVADSITRKVEALPVVIDRSNAQLTLSRRNAFTLNVFSPNDLVLSALAREPLAEKTVDLMTREFTAAYKQPDSWVLMQQLQLSIDRISPIKEERGRYYVGFSSEHEVLRCLSDSVLLYNATDKVYRWSVKKYFPDLSTWDPATVRLEILGPRQGVLRPDESARMSFNLLATTKVEFAQLVQVVYAEEGAPLAAERALYFFLAANIQPPAGLQDYELDRNLLPPLAPSNKIGSGASADVFRVHNFLPPLYSKNYINLAVKKFHLQLEQGLDVAKEDLRRLKLELYISCKMEHPNVVHTLGFIASPLCLVMEYVETNLRSLIDDKTVPLGPGQQNKIALHIAKGMEYLHTYNVTHRDLKPANVLITKQYDAKVADFGISLLAAEESALRTSVQKLERKETVEGTTLYMAPENFLDSGKRAKEGDVYSFGVILLELSMRICLVEQLPDVSRAVFLHARKAGLPPLPWEKISVADTSVLRLIRACWAFEPEARPTFAQVVASLTEARRAVLQLDLDSELAEARKDGSLISLLENWAGRFDDPDIKRAAKFRLDFMNSRAMSAVLEHLLLAPQLTDEETNAIDRILKGHFGRCPSDLLVNLRSLQPGLAALAMPQTLPFLINSLADSLLSAELRESGSITPKLGLKPMPSGPGSGDKIDLAGVFGWLEFGQSVRRDIRYQSGIGPARYADERAVLQSRMQELQEELNRCNKRLAKLDDPNDSVTYLGKIMGLDPPPPQLPLAVLDRLDTDTTALIRQLTELGTAIDDLPNSKSVPDLQQRQMQLDARLAQGLSAAQALQNAYPSLVRLLEAVPAEELQSNGVTDRLVSLPESWELLATAVNKLRAHMQGVVATRKQQLAAAAVSAESKTYFF